VVDTHTANHVVGFHLERLLRTNAPLTHGISEHLDSRYLPNSTSLQAKQLQAVRTSSVAVRCSPPPPPSLSLSLMFGRHSFSMKLGIFKMLIICFFYFEMGKEHFHATEMFVMFLAFVAGLAVRMSLRGHAYLYMYQCLVCGSIGRVLSLSLCVCPSTCPSCSDQSLPSVWLQCENPSFLPSHVSIDRASWTSVSAAGST
jgi:hypothetical protein